MVVVSDDVHEYAVALKDTDEKIARCPAKVKTESVHGVWRVKITAGKRRSNQLEFIYFYEEL